MIQYYLKTMFCWKKITPIVADISSFHIAFLRAMFQSYQILASNVHWGSPQKMKIVLLFVLRAVLDRTKIKPVEVIASSVPLVHS